MGVILAAADAVQWYAELTNNSASTLTSQLGELKAPQRPLFLPYLSGERTPHNDANVRGCFLGLERGTDTSAGTRTVLEGVSFALRDCCNALTKNDSTIENLIALGGGSASRYWLKNLATNLNTAIDIPAVGNFGAAFGAARLVVMAATDASSDEIAYKPEIANRILPDANLSHAFDSSYARYKSTYQAIKYLS